jgi:putative transposase
MIEFKCGHSGREVIPWDVRWYVAYPISYRQLEEMMSERGVEVDHATLNRRVVKYVPLLENSSALTSARSDRVGEWTTPM